jgi:hypothetical protein
MSVAEKLHGLAQQVAFDVIQFPEYAARASFIKRIPSIIEPLVMSFRCMDH